MKSDAPLAASTGASINQTGLSASGLLDEVVSTLVVKPKRSILTAMGTFLGVGALAAILGLTATASGQVSARFDALAATTVEVVDARSSTDQTSRFPLDDDAITRVRRLNGVTGAGVLYAPRTKDKIASANPEHATGLPIPIWAASPGAWEALEPTMTSGRTYDSFTDSMPVAVLGAGAANQLGISANLPTAITIGGRPFTVMGVFNDTLRRQELRMAVVVPTTTAHELWGTPQPDDRATLLVATRPGAAVQVAREARKVASFLTPENITVADPPDPRKLREAISEDLTSLFYALAVVSLILGAVGIGNTTLVAVMERQAEIGLRRALGARSRDIASQVLLESATLGLLGGIAGSAAGLTTVLIVALTRDWTPIIDPLILLLAPGIGLGVGVLAGLYPMLKAIRIEPTQALRGA